MTWRTFRWRQWLLEFDQSTDNFDIDYEPKEDSGKSTSKTEDITDTTFLFGIVSSSVLQSLLKRYVVCSNCREDLVIIKDSARCVLGVSWKLKCKNEYCTLPQWLLKQAISLKMTVASS